MITEETRSVDEHEPFEAVCVGVLNSVIEVSMHNLDGSTSSIKMSEAQAQELVEAFANFLSISA